RRVWRGRRASAGKGLGQESRPREWVSARPPTSPSGRVFADKLVGALIPFRAWIVGAEHCGGLLRFFGDGEREIAFRQPHQRFAGVAARLILVDHLTKTDRGGQPVASALVETTDLHFLA